MLRFSNAGIVPAEKGLHSPQRRDQLHPCRPQRRHQASGQAHEQGEGEAFAGDAGGEGETEGEFGEGLPVHGGDGDELHEGGEKDPGQATEQAEEQGLGDKRQQNVAAAEAEGAQGADFGDAAGDGGVHGDHGADDRADGKDQGQGGAEDAQEGSHGRRLVGVEPDLPLGLHRQARVGLDALLVAVEGAGVAQAKDYRGVDRATEGLHQLLHIPPDLGTEAGGAGVENPHHLPVAHAEAQALAQRRAAEASGDAGSGNDLRRPGAGHAPLDQANLRAQGEGGGSDAADDDVGLLVAAPLGQVDQHHRLAGEEGLAVATDGDLGLAGEDRRGIAVDATLHLGFRALADQHQILRRAGVDQGLLQPLDQHQSGREHEHDQGHPGHGQGGGQAPGPEIAQAVGDGDHVSRSSLNPRRC